MASADTVVLGRQTEQEIRSMPSIWRLLTPRVASAVAGVAQGLAAGSVTLLGCGSGHLAGQLGAELLDRAGVMARACTSSDYVLRPSQAVRTASSETVIALSRSGESSETVSAVRAFRRRTSGTVIAATCRPGSTLAGEADTVIDLHEADEQAVPQTRSVSALWLTVLVLAGVYHDRDVRDEIAAVAAYLDSAERRLWATLTDAAAAPADGHVLLGSGLGYTLAAEAALKMTEMGRVPAWAHRTLEYRHGPIEALRPRYVLVGPFGDDLSGVEMAAADEAASLTNHRLDVPALLPPLPTPAAILAQLYVAHVYALLVSRHGGADADAPANIRRHVGDVWLDDAVTTD